MGYWGHFSQVSLQKKNSADRYAYSLLINNEVAGQILASACAELGTLSARFSVHSKGGDGYHSLATLLVELDAFKTRYSKFSIPTERHQSLSLHQASRNVVENDNIPTLYGPTTEWGLAQGSAIGGLRLDEQSLVEKSTNNYHEAFYSMDPTNQQSLGINLYQEEPANHVGMNEHCSQQQNSWLSAHDDAFDGLASPSIKDANLMFHASNFAGSDVPWDSMLDFSSHANAQDVEVSALALEQGANTPLTATVPSAASLASGTGTEQSSIRYPCSGCMTTFSRKADRDRHARSHNPNSFRFSRPLPHCSREFPRKDKLMEHRRRLRH